jgi:4-oxalomesaconate hydratase
MTQFNIMMVHAHPADFACDASGTAALHVEKGDNVTSVVVSYGDRHHMQWLYDQEKKPEKERDPDFANLDAEMYRDFKKRETERIAEILGVELVLLEWTDCEIYFDHDKVMEMAKLILKIKPDIVVTRIPTDFGMTHNDHPMTAKIVSKAIEVAGNRHQIFDGVDLYRGIKQIFYTINGGEEVNGNSNFAPGIVPDVWVDTTSVIEKKVHAIDQLVSQGYHGDTARWIIESRDGRWGMIAGSAYAEPFLRPNGIRYNSLPMPETVIGTNWKPTPVPDARLSASKIPSGTPDSANRLRL